LSVDKRDFLCGWGIGIRTPTNRVRDFSGRYNFICYILSKIRSKPLFISSYKQLAISLKLSYCSLLQAVDNRFGGILGGIFLKFLSR